MILHNIIFFRKCINKKNKKYKEYRKNLLVLKSFISYYKNLLYMYILELLLCQKMNAH